MLLDLLIYFLSTDLAIAIVAIMNMISVGITHEMNWQLMMLFWLTIALKYVIREIHIRNIMKQMPEITSAEIQKLIEQERSDKNHG